MNNRIVLFIVLVFGVIINLAYCVVACDPQRCKNISPLEFFWLLYCMNFGGLVILSPAWITAEILQGWPDWVMFTFVGGPVLLIVTMLPLAWGYVRWRPYVGR